MKSKFSKSFEYTPGEKAGESLERELLGIVKDVGTIEEEQEKVRKRMEFYKLSEFDAALEEVKTKQTQKPENPKQPFANFVCKHLVDLFNLDEDEKLKFYSAVSGTKNKTVLDRDFGVDFFLELEQENKKLVVTVDITHRLFKGAQKADIVFSLPNDFPTHAYFDEKNRIAGLNESEYEIFNKYTEELAQQIAQKLEESTKKDS
jgi:hypothetical protein